MKKFSKILSFILAGVTALSCGFVLSACGNKNKKTNVNTREVLDSVLNSYLKTDYEILIDGILVLHYDVDKKIEGSCYDLSSWSWANEEYYFINNEIEEGESQTFKYNYSDDSWNNELLKDFGIEILLNGTVKSLENNNDNYKIQASKTEDDKTITYTWTFNNSEIIEIEYNNGVEIQVLTVNKTHVDINLPQEVKELENSAIDMTSAE